MRFATLEKAPVAIERQAQPSYWCGQRLRVRKVSPAGESFDLQLDQPFAVVGSHPDCDVQVDEASVDDRTLFVCATAAGVVVVVLSPRAKKAGQTYRLPQGRKIPLGPWLLSFSMEADDNDTSPVENTPLHCLTWKTDFGRHYVQLRHEYPLIIGRRRPAGIVIEDDRLSSLHGAVLRSRDRCWAIDLSSTNGTWSGGVRRRVHAIDRDKSFVVGKQRIHFTQLFAHTREGELSSQVRDLRGRIASMHQCQLETVEDATVQQAGLLASLRSTQDQVAAQRERFEAELTKQDEILTAQQTRIVQLEEDLESAQRELAAHDAWKTSMTDSKHGLQSELDALQDQVDGLRRVRSELDSQLASRETELEMREQELDRLKDEVEDQRRETEALKAELVVERGILKNLELHLQHEEASDAVDPSKDEHCVASPDFHNMLDEALEALPRLDD